MKNLNGHVPDHLRQEYDAANEELRIASELLYLANQRLAEAVLARMEQTSASIITELDTAKAEANIIGKRYNAAIVARVIVSHKLNGTYVDQDRRAS